MINHDIEQHHVSEQKDQHDLNGDIDIIEYVAVSEKFDKKDIIHHDDELNKTNPHVLDAQHTDTDDEIFYFNPELINSKQQAYDLRLLIQQWLCGEKQQQLIAYHPIERSRQIVALSEYLTHHQITQRILICSHSTNMLNEIKQSSQLHSQVMFSDFMQVHQDFDLNQNALSEIEFKAKQVYVGRYQDFLALYGYQNLEPIFNQFDLIIADEIDLVQNQLWQVICQKYYQKWLLNIHLRLPKRIIVA
ncbi:MULTISPECIES: hypothetical protein [unclassified Acinetobacter]|uniref:hypothetical protein n=1 Tax=unclassified Acinetobacter TaxID=196816 RepID=UPI0035B801DA